MAVSCHWPFKNHTALLTSLWISGFEVQEPASSLWLLQNLKVGIDATWEGFIWVTLLQHGFPMPLHSVLYIKEHFGKTDGKVF